MSTCMHALRTVRQLSSKSSHKNASFLARAFSASARRYEINKVVPSAAEAIKDLKSDSTLMCGGFGLCGVPDTLINELEKKPEVTGLTAISNNAGVDGKGLGKLLESGQVKKMIASYVGENKGFEKKYLGGELELELVPQGTLAERCRAAGAGVPAFYTPAGYGTWRQTGELVLKYKKDGTVEKYTEPREVRVFNGKSFILEEAFNADYAFVKAYKADKLGNCEFRLAAQNFNGVMGRAAKVTIVEAENIVEVGDIKPENVHLPAIYVHKVIQSTEGKSFEKYTFAKDPKEEAEAALGSGATASKREKIVKRAAKEFKNGTFANLGIGMPMLAPSFLPASVTTTLQSENGILGLGHYPKKGSEDADLINAGKETVTLNPGAAVFGSEESFAMIRAGKVNLTMLGAMQVSENGDLANWAIPPKLIKGMGGAMDLVANPEVTKVVVLMEHNDRKGGAKIVHSCSFPLTGKACVSRIITELAVFDVELGKGLKLVEVAEGTTVDEIRSKTEAKFEVADNLGTF